MSRRKRTKEELLAELDTLDLPEETLTTFRRVVNTVEEDLTESERRDYEVDLERYIKTMGMIRTGREEGRAEGREEGLIEGFEKGRAEARHQVAQALLKEGIAIDAVSRVTGITVEELKTY